MLFLYFVQERTDVVAGSFTTTADEPCTLVTVRKHFPYRGPFFFRAKVRCAALSEALPWKTVWMDQTSDADPIPTFDHDVVILKALPLFDTSLPDVDGGDARVGADAFSWTAQQYLDWMESRGSREEGWSVDKYPVPAQGGDTARSAPPAAAPPPMPAPAAASAAGSTSASSPSTQAAKVTGEAGAGAAGDDSMIGKVKSLGKLFSTNSDTVKTLTTDTMKGLRSMGKFLSSKAATLSNVLSGKMALPSDEAMVNLTALNIEFRTRFSPSSAEHERCLERLWGAAFSSEPYTRISPLWMTIGFQQNDPTTDLRGSGMLALRCLAYMASRHTRKWEDIISRQRLGDASQYPLAIAAINVTCMLGDVLGLRDGQFNPPKSAFWELFVDGDAFFEIFCIAMGRVDNLWLKYVTSVEEFGNVLEFVKNGIISTLEVGPASVAEFEAKVDEELPL